MISAPSHGRSHPASSSRRSMTMAVVPQMSIPLTRKAGDMAPMGIRTISRAAGSASSPTLTRITAATSPGSTGATAHGRRHQASTGTTRKRVGGMNSSGRVATTSTPPASTPTSSAASRSAAATGPSSSASTAPPGNAGSPACSRSSLPRWMRSRSGPFRPAANKTSTADALPPLAGGWNSGAISIAQAASASSRNHAGMGVSPGITSGSPLRLSGKANAADGVPVAGQNAVELATRADAELGEHLAQVVLDRARADKQPGADLRVGQPVPGQPRNLGLLRGQLRGGLDGRLAGDLAGGCQLAPGPLGERTDAHSLQHLVRGPQLLSRLTSTALAAQPLAVEQVRPGQLCADPGPAQPLDRFPVTALGVLALAEQCADLGFDA